jgi:hypothetical protein
MIVDALAEDEKRATEQTARKDDTLSKVDLASLLEMLDATQKASVRSDETHPQGQEREKDKKKGKNAD